MSVGVYDESAQSLDRMVNMHQVALGYMAALALHLEVTFHQPFRDQIEVYGVLSIRDRLFNTAHRFGIDRWGFSELRNRGLDRDLAFIARACSGRGGTRKRRLRPTCDRFGIL